MGERKLPGAWLFPPLVPSWSDTQVLQKAHGEGRLSAGSPFFEEHFPIPASSTLHWLLGSGAAAAPFQLQLGSSALLHCPRQGPAGQTLLCIALGRFQQALGSPVLSFLPVKASIFPRPPPLPSQQSGGFAANFCFIFKCLLQGY